MKTITRDAREVRPWDLALHLARWKTVNALYLVVCWALAVCLPAAHAEVLPSKGELDSRIRVVTYSPEQVYQLYGFVGYQIDLQFEAGEAFVGLAAGDLQGLSFVAQDNHLFLKPKVAQIGTNLTILTTRRHYQLDYTATTRRPDLGRDQVIYAVRFLYPPAAHLSQSTEAAKYDDMHSMEVKTEHAFAHASDARARNLDYWFCGHPAIKPVAASDDGVQTRLRFNPKSELPALFVRNEDGTESLLNFNIESGEVVIQRIAHRFILRRGKLTGCIVNQHFVGSGDRLDSNTIAPEVERSTKNAPTTLQKDEP